MHSKECVAASDFDTAVAALKDLLCEMALESDATRKYDTYQVTKGAVAQARAALDALGRKGAKVSDPQTELAEYISKCRAMHANHVGKVPTFAHAVSALADRLDQSEARVKTLEATVLAYNAPEAPHEQA